MQKNELLLGSILIKMYTIQNIHIGIKNESKFKRAFSLLFQFIDEQGWSGACHPSVAVLFAICKKLGIQATPCIGEAGINGAAFDHSWLLINGKVFDVAIVWPLNESFATGPIFNGIDLYEQREAEIDYGAFFRGLDNEAKTIFAKDIYTYIIEAPNDLLFDLIGSIGDAIGLTITEEWLNKNLSKCRWEYVCKKK